VQWRRSHIGLGGEGPFVRKGKQGSGEGASGVFIRSCEKANSATLKLYRRQRQMKRLVFRENGKKLWD